MGTREKPPGDRNIFERLGDFDWNEPVSRRRFLAKSAKGAAAVTVVGTLLAILAKLERVPPNILETAVDVTDIVGSITPDTPFNLEETLGPRLSEKAREGVTLARQRGWSDDDFKKMFLNLQANHREVGDATQKIVGERFQFDRIMLIFDPNETVAISDTTNRNQNQLVMNPLSIEYGKEGVLRTSEIVLFHEISHVLLTENARRMMDPPRGREFLNFPLEKHQTQNFQAIQPNAAMFSIGEVCADLLGHQLAQTVGRGDEFIADNRRHTESELARYEGNLGRNETDFLEILDILSIKTVTAKLGMQDLSDRTGQIQKRMIQTITQLGARPELIKDLEFVDQMNQGMANDIGFRKP